MFSVRPRFGPTIPHLLSQIRHGDVQDRRHLEPRVPSIFPGNTRRAIPPDICLRQKAYEKARRNMDETAPSLSLYHAIKVKCIKKSIIFLNSSQVFQFQVTTT